MSASDNTYGLEHLIGKAAVVRLNNPSIRGSVRRNNPDGGHASPYYTGLSGTSLVVDVSPVGDLTLNFVSDELDDAITMINAVSSANLQASDDDGYLRLTNLNGGGKNYIRIESGSAAPVLGFVLHPEAGSFSSAGEIETAPPGRGINTTQSNPQGTVLLGADENLSTRSANRAALGILAHIERIGRELDVEIPGVKEFFPVSVTTHAATGKKVFFITDDELRIPTTGFGQLSSDLQNGAGDQFGHLLTTGRQQVIDVSQNPPRAAVIAAYNNDGSSATADITQSFTTYGVYDGRSVFGDVAAKLKHVAVPITSIRGNIIQANTATFLARFVQPGDVVLIEGATNNSPFNHNGEFIVDAVLDATRIAIRAKRESDPAIVSTDKPTSLNATLPGGASYGTISILIGNFYTAGFTVMFEVPGWVPTGTYRARLLTGYRLRTLPHGALAKFFEPNPDAILGVLRNHIALDSVGFRHAAVDVDAPAVAGSPNALSSGTVGSQLAELLNHLNTLIAGEVAYGGGINWADGTTNPATNLEAQVDKILNDLAAPGVDGVAKIRGLAINFLSAGTLRDQLIQLENQWFKLDRANTITNINSFAANQSSNNATWVYGAGNALDKPSMTFGEMATAGQKRLIIEFGRFDLIQIRIYLDDALNMEITYNAKWDPNTSTWGKDIAGSGSPSFLFQVKAEGGLLRHRASGAGTWADGAWTQQTSFDLNLVTSLFSFLGKMELGAGLVGTSTNAEQPRVSMVGADSSLTRRTLLFQTGSLATSGHFIRVYSGDTRAEGTAHDFEICLNCSWNNSTGVWTKDHTGLNSSSIRFSRNRMEVNHRDTSAGTWNDTGWTRTHTALEWAFNAITLGDVSGTSLNMGTGVLSFDGAVPAGFTNPASNTSVTNELRAKNICKGWAIIQIGLGGSPSVLDGFNITSASYTGFDLQVTIGSNMANTNYCVLTSGISTDGSDTAAKVVPYNLATGTFNLAAFINTTRVSLVSIAGGDRKIHVAWFGEQS